jgi:hypothetical protein
VDETAAGGIPIPSGGNSSALYGMNLSHSMQQQQMLETSLGEDFLSLFAPG